MIFLDANFILRALTDATDPDSQEMAHTARSLFDAATRGDEEITTTEGVLNQVAYVLRSNVLYKRTVPETTAAIRALLLIPGFHLHRGQKRTMLRALELWDASPRLGFMDSVVAAYAQLEQIPLATFDNDFNRIPGIIRWQPPFEQ
jgi:predicted nucleic acid-binding protein